MSFKTPVKALFSTYYPHIFTISTFSAKQKRALQKTRIHNFHRTFAEHSHDDHVVNIHTNIKRWHSAICDVKAQITEAV
jgi:hypothetical protein